MGDYPNSDEEFDLMYGDELQILNDQEDDELDVHTAGPPSRKSLDFSTPKNKPKSQTSQPKTQEPKPCSSKQATLLENSFDRDFHKLDDSDLNSKKRGIEDLFGDIGDLLLEEEKQNLSKKPKTEDEKRKDDEELIERILEMRKKALQELNPNLSINNMKQISSYEHIKNNVSVSVPKFPFIGVTRHDGERIYVRMHNEEYEKEDIKRITSNSSYKGLMGTQSADMWKEANQIISQHIDAPSTNPNTMEVEETHSSKLWVDLYKPRKYIGLLSDESTNRTLLKWLKLWDKIVFHRRPKVRTKPKPQLNTFGQQFLKKELDLTLDESDRPQYKIALLCGAPGLGKTTLAHMVAKHCGYNVVEINASDDRNVESFKKALENATQMISVIDQEKRPNCLVFDEIDGAPSAAIDFLIKFINGTAGKKGKKQKHVLKRPIICICNDVYVPALRPLRQIAFILNFPPTSTTRLAERLLEISRYQNIKTDLGAMIALSEKTNNDIRSCLTVLNFFKTKNKAVTLSEVHKTTIGQKDMQKGLFTVWNDIFEIKHPANKDGNLTERMKTILETVIRFGDYDRLMQGVFENYPLVKHKGTPFYPICGAMEWFGYTDLMNKKIQESQNYAMWSYLPYGFVVWHFAFASFQKKKIAYPSVGYEVTTKQTRNVAITSEILRGMPPTLRVYTTRPSLLLDTIPMLADILVPTLRTINVSLYAPQEKAEITNVVAVMLDHNLTYVQERTAEGGYAFVMDPNIEEVLAYPGVRAPRRQLSYTSRQMLAREVEMEKMRRMERAVRGGAGAAGGSDRGSGNVSGVAAKAAATGKENVEENKQLPNHLQRLQPKSIKPKDVVVKDFFGRAVSKPAKPKFGDGSEQSFAGDIWFQFKEGYSNAVRRRVKMRNLLHP